MRILLCLLAISLSGLALAVDDKPVYKCADAEGNVKYQKTKCKNIESAAELNVNTGGYRYLAVEQQRIDDEHEANLTEEEKLKLEKSRKELEKMRLLAECAEQAQKNQEYLSSKKDNFSPYAIPPYQGKRYEDIVANFLPRLAEIERYRRAAAAK